MRILAVVTARGGSKRVPGKNTRELGGKPLIAWSIEVAKLAGEICDTLVSTDDPRIADIARGAGALVPWLRPEALATDTASSVSVCLHALDWYERESGAVDGLMLLQPTSPFRRLETIERGIGLFRERARRPVIGVSPAKSHPLHVFAIEGDKMRPFVPGDASRLRTQDLPPAYAVNGAFYLISPQDLRERESFFTGDMQPLVISDRDEALDIDTERDWQEAELILRARPEDHAVS